MNCPECGAPVPTPRPGLAYRCESCGFTWWQDKPKREWGPIVAVLALVLRFVGRGLRRRGRR